MLELIIISVALFIVFLVILFCFITGIKFRKGEWLMLIAGYNDFPKETRDKMDRLKIGREASDVSITTGLFLSIEALFVWCYSQYSIKQMGLLMILLTIGYLSYVVRHVKQSNDYYKQFK